MEYYHWYKAFHIIAVIAWLAGMLYLPRLFVYHAAANNSAETSETFKIMEKKLLKYIMNPAMVATYIFGILIITQSVSYYMSSGWLHAKLTLVLILSATHGYFAKLVKDFAQDNNQHTEKFYRIINEVPTILMIAIVILVVVKPF